MRKPTKKKESVLKKPANKIPLSIDDIVRKADLVDLYLSHSSTDLYVPARSVMPAHLIMENESDSNYSLTDDRSILVCHIGMTISAKQKGNNSEEMKEGQKIFSLRATYCLVFRLEDGLSLSDEAIEQFSKENGFYIVYSYMREFFNTATARMGIPPYRLPLLKPLSRSEAKSLEANQ